MIICLHVWVSSLVAGMVSIALLLLTFIFFNIFFNRLKTRQKQKKDEMHALTHSASHELRAPLHHILAFTQIILKDHSASLQPEAQDALARVVDATHKMKQVLDGILDLSKYMQSELLKERVNLSHVAQGIANEFQQTNPRRKVNFVIQENLLVNGDSRLLTVVMTNLISNAYKFTSQQADAHIEFGMFKKNGVDTYFLRDNGAGLDMRHSNMLFCAFQRLHTGHEFSGVGLGLVSVQQIINRHDGRIWAEAELKKGTTFFFTLKRNILCIQF